MRQTEIGVRRVCNIRRLISYKNVSASKPTRPQTRPASVIHVTFHSRAVSHANEPKYEKRHVSRVYESTDAPKTNVGLGQNGARWRNILLYPNRVCTHVYIYKCTIHVFSFIPCARTSSSVGRRWRRRRRRRRTPTIVSDSVIRNHKVLRPFRVFIALGLSLRAHKHIHTSARLYTRVFFGKYKKGKNSSVRARARRIYIYIMGSIKSRYIYIHGVNMGLYRAGFGGPRYNAVFTKSRWRGAARERNVLTRAYSAHDQSSRLGTIVTAGRLRLRRAPNE